jgi:dimeric dUTPase (all-alpha-NTP-PPase superfamily)
VERERSFEVPGAAAPVAGAAGQDKLETIFRLQALFDDELARRRGLDFADRGLWVQREMTAMMVEACEVLSEVNYKWWKDPREISREKVLDEMADILHFFTAACLRMGFTASDLFSAYCAKNRENFRRQHGESERQGYKS